MNRPLRVSILRFDGRRTLTTSYRVALLAWLIVANETARSAPPIPGTVVEWGTNYSKATVPAGLGPVTAIAAGCCHTVALKSDGTVALWGFDAYDQLKVPAGLNGVIAIAAGAYHTLVLKSDGTVVTWGNRRDGLTTVPAGLSGVKAIAAGGYASVALKYDGTVVLWGATYGGILNVPTGLSGVTEIALGYAHVLALKNDGTVVAWGDNFFGQTAVPPGLSGVTAVASGGFHSVALKADGTVVAWGDNSYGQTTVPPGLTGFAAIAAGTAHTVALHREGTVAAWGGGKTLHNGPAPSGEDEEHGQSIVPAGLSGVIAIAASGEHTLALKAILPRAAAAFASVINGLVTGASIIDHGFGYTNNPTVAFSGGGGFGAKATATAVSGVVTAIEITAQGSGYSSPPQLSIAPPLFTDQLTVGFFTNDKIQVRFTVDLGGKYRVESSNDLTTWVPTDDTFLAEGYEQVRLFGVEAAGRYFRLIKAP